MPDILSVTSHDPADGVRVISMSGELDHDSVTLLRAAIEGALADHRDRLVADLAGVAFCDSAGLSLFVETHRRTAARGGWFRLAAPPAGVRYVLEATNLERYLGIHSSVAEALDPA